MPCAGSIESIAAPLKWINTVCQMWCRPVCRSSAADPGTSFCHTESDASAGSANRWVRDNLVPTVLVNFKGLPP